MLLAVNDGLNFRGVGENSLSTHYFKFDNLSPVNNGTTSSAHPKYIPGTKTSVNYFMQPDNMFSKISKKGQLSLYRQEYGSTSVHTFFEAEIPNIR